MGGPDSCDPAMRELFRAEMETHVPVLSQGLLLIEKGRAGDKDLEAMMRAAHSIKGAARIVGIEPAVRVSHGMEDCFSAAQTKRVVLDSEAVDVLLQGVDALQRICSPEPNEGMSEESIRSLLDRIAVVRDGRQSIPPGESEREASAPAVSGELVSGTILSPENHLTLPAVLDDSAVESLRAELSETLRRNPAGIRLDFAQVRQVSAAALSLLASFAREVSGHTPAVTVDAKGVQGPMAVLLRTTGLDSTFKESD